SAPRRAKLRVVAEDRDMALARLARALDELVVTGIQTTVPFDRWLVDEPHFRAGDLSTDFVPDHWDPAPVRTEAAHRAPRRAAEAWAAGLAAPSRPTLAGTPTAGDVRSWTDGR